MLKICNVAYSYNTAEGSTPALYGINADINSGITAIIGHTGSGKSTLAEIISGITAPLSGKVEFDGQTLRKIKNKIGMVFQYPEHQLFAETVYDDIAYGIRQKGLGAEEIKKQVISTARLVGLSEKQLSMSPFQLSGGQQRMAALAGILVFKPRLLVLDEPAAGLDPSTKRHMFGIIQMLINKDPSMIIVFITHSMEDAAEYAEDILLLDKGRLIAHSSPDQLFASKKIPNECRPAAARLSDELIKHGIDVGNVFTEHSAAAAILKIYKGGGRNAP